MVHFCVCFLGVCCKAGCVCCRVVSWVRRRKAEPDLFTAVPHCGSSFIPGCLTVFCVEVLRFPRLFSKKLCGTCCGSDRCKRKPM